MITGEELRLIRVTSPPMTKGMSVSRVTARPTTDAAAYVKTVVRPEPTSTLLPLLGRIDGAILVVFRRLHAPV